MALGWAIALVITALVCYVAYEHATHRWKRAWLNGPSWVPPFVGTAVAMVRRPHKYYTEQKKFGDLSWNSVMGRFFLFCAKTDIIRKVFNNPDDSLRVILTLSAPRLLGGDNIVFMSGAPHKTLRKQILPLFTRRALGVYVRLQEKLIRDHIEKWLKKCEREPEVEIRLLARDLNIETSYTTFIGPYIGGNEKLKELSKHFLEVNEGFLALPIYFPGTTLWSAVRCRIKIVDHLISAVKQSRERMAKNMEPECLLDFWMESVKTDDPNSYGHLMDIVTDNKKCVEHHAAKHILDFLFASQDASTASLVWMCHLLDEHPDVLKKVREEQARVRANDEPITPELLDKMPYAYQVVKEILRFRPPATMVPHVAVKEFQLLDNYTVPKGSIVLPSIWDAQFEGFTDPAKFDPDRFSPERREDVTYAKHFLAFGTGPHICIGQRYAMNHLTAFMALMTTHVDWHRTRPDNPKNKDIAYLPTIYPADGCVINLKKRKAAAN